MAAAEPVGDDAPDLELPATVPRPWGHPVLVGVLGGMGPYATIQFMKNVLDLTPARKDWEHVRMVVDNNCHVPSRTRAILFDEVSPEAAMLDSCQRLQGYPVDLIAIPCNSASYWAPRLQQKVKTPILDIVSTAVRELLAREGVGRVAALGGMVPHLTELYRVPLEAAGGTYVKIGEDNQEEVAAAIESAKAAGSGTAELRENFRNLVAKLADDYGLDGVVLACTEFSFFHDEEFPLLVVDSSLALARAVVDFAVHGKPLHLDIDNIKDFWDSRATMVENGEAGMLQATMLTASNEETAQRERLEKDSFLKFAGPILEKTGSLLELGCGAGRWTGTLAQRVEHVDAYDYCEGLVNIARRNIEDAGIRNVRLHNAAVEDIEVDKVYDAVVSIALLHYLDERQFLAAMRLIKTVTRPGGHVFFRETFGVHRRFELHGFYSEVLDTQYHAVYRTYGQVAQEMGSAFELIRCETTLAPSPDKPETCQQLLVFRRAD